MWFFYGMYCIVEVLSVRVALSAEAGLCDGVVSLWPSKEPSQPMILVLSRNLTVPAAKKQIGTTVATQYQVVIVV